MLREMEILRRMLPIYQLAFNQMSKAHLLSNAHKTVPIDGELDRVNLVEVLQIGLLLLHLLLYEVQNDVLGKRRGEVVRLNEDGLSLVEDDRWTLES